MSTSVFRVLLLLMLFGLPVFAAPKTVVVQKGDSLWGIAKRHGLSVEQLKRYNQLSDNLLHPGQRLRLSPSEPTWAVKLTQGPVLGVPIVAVHVNLSNPRVQVRPLLPPPGLGRGGEQLHRLAWRRNLVAAINGGYFHPRTYDPVGDLVVDGRRLSRGQIRTALAITPDNRAFVYAGPVPTAWRGYRTVIANGPYVLRGGRLLVDPRMEGYRDPAIWNRARRSAVALVNQRHLVFFSTSMPITLSELAKVATRLGAKDVLVLDGGSSTGFIWQQHTLIRPARPLSYGIGIFVGRNPLL